MAESWGGRSGKKDVAVGDRIFAGVGETVGIHHIKGRQVGKISEMVTELDAAVYCSVQDERRSVRFRHSRPLPGRGLSGRLSGNDRRRGIDPRFLKKRAD
ncbi:MAG: hypothetical protein II888_06600 [Clostridia bacterium]|nr:hypothetical protein [Clostridia bacterium]